MGSKFLGDLLTVAWTLYVIVMFFIALGTSVETASDFLLLCMAHWILLALPLIFRN